VNTRCWLVIIVAMLVASCGKMVGSRCASAYRELRGVKIAIERFETTEGRYPVSLQEMVGAGYLDWGGPLLDPWGQPYAYRRVSSGYELYSTGADRLPRTADDITAEVVPMGCPGPIDGLGFSRHWR